MRGTDSFEKTLMLRKIEGERRRGRQRMRWLDGITDLTDMSLSNSRSWWWTGRPGVLWSMGSQRVGHDWATELNWTCVVFSYYLTNYTIYLRRWFALPLFLLHYLFRVNWSALSIYLPLWVKTLSSKRGLHSVKSLYKRCSTRGEIATHSSIVAWRSSLTVWKGKKIWHQKMIPQDQKVSNMLQRKFSSVTQSCPTLCDPMDDRMTGFPVYHQLPEFVQTHVHQVGDVIQPPHPLSSPSPPAFNLSQHQGLFKWVSFSHQVAKTFEFQHQTFQWIFRTDCLSDWLVWYPCSPRDSQESSPTPQFKSINSLAISFFYSPLSHTYMTIGKTIGFTRWTFVDKVMSLLFNMLSRLVIAFLPKSKCLFISWL